MPPTSKAFPDPSTVVAQLKLAPRAGRRRGTFIAGGGAPRKPRYTILRTKQVDAYEPQPGDAAIRAAPAAMAVAGDSFKGKKRKAVKISLVKAKLEKFTDVKALVAKLPSDQDMLDLEPRIIRGENSKRVKEEKRNVRLRGWLYAASRESDNDFHLIVGRDPKKSPMYLTMEISGLPPSSASSHKTLKKVRNAYKDFFTDLPGSGYDFYKPPIPIEIGGPLFFDIQHATGGRPGPADLRPDIPVIWEIHPVSHLVFEPDE